MSKPGPAVVVARRLAALPATADAIAEMLHLQGITGVLNDPCHCALARYLRGDTNIDIYVTVTGVKIYADKFSTEAIAAFDVPPALLSFIRRFDQLTWPNLVEGERDPECVFTDKETANAPPLPPD